MTEKIEYKTHGTCSRKILIEIEDDRIKSVEFRGGCPGNTKGVSTLVAGMKVDDVISKLSGIRCGFKPTSCPDQLATALTEYRNGR